MGKGQAALEFLTTYGWAFLVILVMIGALAYFGVLNPQKYLPEKCIITTGLDCTDFQITATAVNLKITNNLGVSLSSGNVTLIHSNASQYTCNPQIATMSSGSTTEFTCGGGGGSVGTGNKMRYQIAINYTKSGSTYGKSAYGEIFATVG
jgi:hypothetical protein